MKRFVPLFALFALALAPAALAQRHIIGAGSDDEESPRDAGPPPAKAPPAKKEPEAKKKDDKKKAEKKDDKKGDKKKKAGPADVLEETPDEKAARSKAEDARDKAEKAAEDAEKKKEEQKQKLLEEKKEAEAKRRLENRDQRLAAAKRVRQITRESGDIAVAFAIEPGFAQGDKLLAIRAAVARKLDVPDPRYGNRMPLRDLQLTATVSGNGKKVQYEVHPLETPGRYGFHTTPWKDGSYLISLEGQTKDHKPISVSFPLHVGVWPPPDFDTEEKNNLKSDAARNGRHILGEN